jgi:hypothetical protein
MSFFNQFAVSTLRAYYAKSPPVLLGRFNDDKSPAR